MEVRVDWVCDDQRRRLEQELITELEDDVARRPTFPTILYHGHGLTTVHWCSGELMVCCQTSDVCNCSLAHGLLSDK